MPAYGWLIIIGLILIMWWLWSKYGALYTAIRSNPTVFNAGQSVVRYATDVEGLVNAFQASDDNDGTFSSRLGTFFGALPK